MKKILLILLVTFCVLSVKAQRKFFQSIQVTPFWYFDDIRYDRESWKKQFRDPFKPMVQNFDTLEEAYPREWGFRINGGFGFQIRAQRSLPLFREGSRSKLDWNLGAGHRTFGMTSYSYSSAYAYNDTSKPFIVESETLQLKQNWADLYNSVVYSFYSRGGGFHVFIGLGLQGSLSFNSRINEIYCAIKSEWNTGQQNWYTTNFPVQSKTTKAKNSKAFSYTVPIGWGLSLSKDVSLESSMEIFHSWHSPNFGQKNFSEGAMFQLSFRYKL